jgi:hypothetical protein
VQEAVQLQKEVVYQVGRNVAGSEEGQNWAGAYCVRMSMGELLPFRLRQRALGRLDWLPSSVNQLVSDRRLVRELIPTRGMRVTAIFGFENVLGTRAPFEGTDSACMADFAGLGTPAAILEGATGAGLGTFGRLFPATKGR